MLGYLACYAMITPALISNSINSKIDDAGCGEYMHTNELGEETSMWCIPRLVPNMIGCVTWLLRKMKSDHDVRQEICITYFRRTPRHLPDQMCKLQEPQARPIYFNVIILHNSCQILVARADIGRILICCKVDIAMEAGAASLPYSDRGMELAGKRAHCIRLASYKSNNISWSLL